MSSFDLEIRMNRFPGSWNRKRPVSGSGLEVVPRTPRSNLFRFQSKVWLDMQCRCMPNKPEVWTS